MLKELAIFVISLSIVFVLTFLLISFNTSAQKINSTVEELNISMTSLVEKVDSSGKKIRVDFNEYENTLKNLIGMISNERESYFENLTIFFAAFSIIFALIAIVVPILLQLSAQQGLKDLKEQFDKINTKWEESKSYFDKNVREFERINLENSMIKLTNNSILLAQNYELSQNLEPYRKNILDYLDKIKKSNGNIEFNILEIKDTISYLIKSLDKIVITNIDRPLYSIKEELKKIIDLEQNKWNDLTQVELLDLISNFKTKINSFFDEYNKQLGL